MSKIVIGLLSLIAFGILGILCMGLLFVVIAARTAANVQESQNKLKAFPATEAKPD